MVNALRDKEEPLGGGALNEMVITVPPVTRAAIISRHRFCPTPPRSSPKVILGPSPTESLFITKFSTPPHDGFLKLSPGRFATGTAERCQGFLWNGGTWYCCASPPSSCWFRSDLATCFFRGWVEFSETRRFQYNNLGTSGEANSNAFEARCSSSYK